MSGDRSRTCYEEGVPRFEPFHAIRYDTARVDLAEVTAPPYDVIDGPARAALAERHPHNVVHIDCPVAAEHAGDGAGSTYADAGARFADWQRQGILVRDTAPSLYVYRMTFRDDHGRDRHTTGVLGSVGLEPPGEGDVLPHEDTTRKARSDRLQLLQVTRANLSAIWFLSLATGLTKLLDDPGPQIASWSDDGGVTHTLWHLADAVAIDSICGAVAGAPLVIADGHHRYETSLAYRAERRAASGGASGAYDATLGFVVELVEDELDIEPIHRVVSGLPEGFDVLGPLGASFEIGPVQPATPAVLDRMDAEQALAAVTVDGVRLLWPRPDTAVAEADLDTRRFDLALAGFPAHDLAFRPGFATVAADVQAGRAQAALLVRPPSIAQIAAAAHARRRMPPKTTFFWPKPRSGLAFRSLA
jgi:uncharacterized protein (DUF1015 family)